MTAAEPPGTKDETPRVEAQNCGLPGTSPR